MRIAIRRVGKLFGRFAALDDVSLDLSPGQTVAIVGANGAGKTTLLNCLATLTAPTSGQIVFDDQLLARDRLDLRRRLAFLPDSPVLAAPSTIAHVALLVRLYSQPDERPPDDLSARVVEWLRETELLAVAEQSPSTLSRGERYKAALVGLLAVDPELWLLDEPFASGMDPAGLALLRREMRAASQRGRTILFTTQLLEIAEQVADRVAVIADGKLLAWGTLNELRRQTGTPVGESLARVFAQLHAERS